MRLDLAEQDFLMDLQKWKIVEGAARRIKMISPKVLYMNISFVELAVIYVGQKLMMSSWL